MAYLRRKGDNCTCETCRSYHASKGECQRSWPRQVTGFPRPWPQVDPDDYCDWWTGTREALARRPLPPGSHHKKPPMTWPECLELLMPIGFGPDNAKTFAALHQFIRRERRLKVSEFRALLERGEECGGVFRKGERYYLNKRQFLSDDLVFFMQQKAGPITWGEIEALVAETYPNRISINAETDSAVENATQNGFVDYVDATGELILTEKGKAKGPPSPAEDLEIE